MNYKKAVEILFEETPMEIVYDFYETPYFFEFRGECGGDLMAYRVYKNNGMVTSR